MTVLSLLVVAAAGVFVALVVVAQLLTPEQSAVGMGMSGLVHGRARLLMKAAFVARGVSALALVAALPAALPRSAWMMAGLTLFWLWGAGSALLALYDTDMPGEAPTRRGEAHAIIALVAYVAGVAGMVVLSFVLRGEGAAAGTTRWALPIALAAAVALLAQFAAFGAAARTARGLATSGPGGGAPAAAAPGGAPADAAPAAVAPAAPPQLVASTVAPGSAPARPAAKAGLGPFAGLLQRLFVALVVLWTVVVAAGL